MQIIYLNLNDANFANITIEPSTVPLLFDLDFCTWCPPAPEHVGEVGGELLGEGVVAPVEGGVAEHHAPHRPRAQHLPPGRGQPPSVQGGGLACGGRGD